MNGRPSPGIQSKLQEMGRQIKILTELHFELLEELGPTNGDSPGQGLHSTELPPSPGGDRQSLGTSSDQDNPKEEVIVELPSNPGGKSQTQDLPLLDAILVGNADKLRKELRNAGSNPNMTYTDMVVLGKKYVKITPLAVAALCGNQDMMHTLVAAGASVESAYSFHAGAQGQVWTGTAAVVPCCKGNLELLKEMVELKADINTRGSNGATLVWQASYFGREEILKYLIDMGVSLELKAQSPDNDAMTHTPLHVGIIRGHSSIVDLLLRSRARLDVDDGRGRSLLRDAVSQGHTKIMHSLIVSSADLFRTEDAEYDKQAGTLSLSASMTPQFSGRECTGTPTCMARIFDSGNTVLVSVVAKALKDAPDLMDRMSKGDFLKFLASGSEASLHAFDAIFSKQTLLFWQKEGCKWERGSRTKAFVPVDQNMNIMSGPHQKVISDLYKSKTDLPESIRGFIDGILPIKKPASYKSKYVPVEAFMCHIPNVHRDLHVLLAVSNMNCEIFASEGCCALINWMWAGEMRTARFRMSLATVELCNFMCFNYLFDEVATANQPRKTQLVLSVISVIIWLLAVFFELMQCMGYLVHGFMGKYFRSPRHCFDIVVLILTGCFIIAFWNLDEELVSSDEFATLLGTILFLKWFRFITYLRQVRVIGHHILPMMQTMGEVGPFLLVLGVYLLASTNLYWAFRNNYSLFECFFLIYRLAVLGDFSIGELEHKARPHTSKKVQEDMQQASNGTEATFLFPDGDTAWFSVRFMLVIVSFMVGVLIMNLFIAVLCSSYDRAASVANKTFMRSRAKIVLDQVAVRAGSGFFVRRLMQKRAMPGANCGSYEVKGSRILDSSESLASNSESATSAMALSKPESTTSFLWYVKQASVDD